LTQPAQSRELRALLFGRALPPGVDPLRDGGSLFPRRNGRRIEFDVIEVT
jgi:hypothetical protein